MKDLPAGGDATLMDEAESSVTARDFSLRRRDAPERQARDFPLSVVIPARNAAAHLGHCLEALQANPLSNTEIIVVDDGSRDDTPEVVKRAAQRSTVRLLLLSQPESTGPAAARNRGAESAAHPWLLFLDSDILLPPDALGRIRESLDLYRHRPDIAGVLGTYSETIPAADFFSNFKNLYTCYLYRVTETLSPFLHTPIFCIRREILLQAGGFEPSLRRGEDFRLGLTLGSRGLRFVIDRKVQGVHLKRYTLTQILAEDWQRIRELSRIRLNRAERRFSYQAHRWNRLMSLAIPGPAVIAALLSVWSPAFLWVTLLLGIFFALCNLRFLLYCRNRKGIFFAAGSLLFLFLEMLWAEAALIASATVPYHRDRDRK